MTLTAAVDEAQKDNSIPSSGLSAARVEEIEQRMSKATPGPWFVVLGSGNHLCTGIAADILDATTDEARRVHIADCLPEYALKDGGAPDDHRPNMEFIAHARTDIPDLLAEVRRLQGELASAREETAQAVRDDRLSQERVWEAIRAAYVAGVAGTLRFKECEDRKPFHYGRAAKAHATRTIEEMLARSLPGETADA